jgi:L-asparaginase
MFFDNTLFRGNRVQKVSANAMHGFDSANYPPLGTLGLEYFFLNFIFYIMLLSLYIHQELIRHPPTEPFSVLQNASDKVVLLHLYPGISGQLVKTILESGVSGVVLLAFGAGNGPDRDQVFLSAITDAVKRGIPIVDISQCHQSRVDLDEYGAAFALKQAGVISGYDLTPEAAFTKLAVLLGNPKLTYQDVVAQLQSNLRGELTSPAKHH